MHKAGSSNPRAGCSTVRITTGSRLHFGLLAHNPATEGWGGVRQFGGVGLMVDSPGFQISARVHDRDVVVGSPESRTRGEDILAGYRTRCPDTKQPPPCRIEISQAIPPHVGFGSGTQLALAIGEAVALLAGDDDADLLTRPRRVGRGARSALGIHGFYHGGLLVDGGKQTAEEIGTLVARAEFPSAWRIVLLTPSGEAGLSGIRERDAFARLPPMPQATTDRLCRIALMQLLPAVLEADFHATSESLFEFGHIAGDYFAALQGGTYARTLISRLVDELRAKGVRGIAQSSWGPTIGILCRDAAAAERLVTEISTDRRFRNCRLQTATAMNTGALIERE